jgi:hypothetical protein
LIYFDKFFNNILEEEIDEIVSNICQTNRNLGEVMTWGMLKSKDIYISRKKLRDSLKRIDIEGVERRKKRALKRRVYSVPHANYLWHLDGHHKLIRQD